MGWGKLREREKERERGIVDFFAEVDDGIASTPVVVRCQFPVYGLERVEWDHIALPNY